MYFSSYMNLTDLTVVGLNDFDIKVLEFIKLKSKLSFDLTFNDIQVLGQYYADGNLFYPDFNLKAYGLGDVNLVLQELRLNGSCRLVPHLKGLKVTHFKIGVNIGYVKSKFTGILNNKYATIFFNRWLEEFLSMGINDETNKQIISAVISDFVETRANGFLANYTLVDLIKLILEFTGGSQLSEKEMFVYGIGNI